MHIEELVADLAVPQDLHDRIKAPIDPDRARKIAPVNSPVELPFLRNAAIDQFRPELFAGRGRRRGRNLGAEIRADAISHAAQLGGLRPLRDDQLLGRNDNVVDLLCTIENLVGGIAGGLNADFSIRNIDFIRSRCAPVSVKHGVGRIFHCVCRPWQAKKDNGYGTSKPLDHTHSHIETTAAVRQKPAADDKPQRRGALSLVEN
jgi:hypothetical protein